MDIDVIYNEDCLEVLKRLEDNSIDAIVTDPPYNLGFMGKKWDKTGIAFNLELWRECLRVIKPGGNLLSFGGTRTYHRMTCAIEDAGFEIRDCIAWCYGSGFPKSLNIGKAVDKILGNEREIVGYKKHTYPDSDNWGEPKNISSDGYFQSEKKHTKLNHIPIEKGTSEWEGYGTGLKPSYEPITLCMKPLEGTFAENCLKWGVGGLNIDECRVEGQKRSPEFKNPQSKGIWQGTEQQTNWDNSKGRFPANFIHDGSQEVMELFPERKGWSSQKHNKFNPYGGNSFNQSQTLREGEYEGYNDNGSAARFFYCAKASKKERNMGLEDMPLQGGKANELTARGNTNPVCQNCGGSKIDRGNGICQCEFPEWRAINKPQQNSHPTVKPLALMEYLVKLVTRPSHIVLDPFIGSGTTAMACVKTGRHYIGCEVDKGYYDIAIKRIEGMGIVDI